jgi:mannobiose 2-epimerase
MVDEIRGHLTGTIIPFWKKLRDDEFGGYYGYMDFDLNIDQKAVKGCILNSRILWFFANAYMLLQDESLLDEARHAFTFLKEHGVDKDNGGVFWSLRYDGEPEDTTKHTYNQAFAVYALSSYYDASGDEEALALARELFQLIEERCTDEIGYREAFNRAFVETENDKLSENGVMAEKTMNTLLHVFEAYTELYRVSRDADVGKRLKWILDTIADKVYNPALHRQEVFFDKNMNSILDLHSYGHDIETAWLIERGTEILGETAYIDKMRPIVLDLTQQIYKTAFDGHSIANECEKGVVNTKRIWWVQAEAVLGFLNGYKLAPGHTEYLDAARAEWDFIKTYMVDKRPGSEWYANVTAEGQAFRDPIVEPWKCPYHNGRMCMEVIKRSTAAEQGAKSILFFDPVMKQTVWGGRRLGDEWGYDIPDGNVGECWGICANPHGDCRVREGIYKGRTLSELWKDEPQLFGYPKGDRFPLLTKLLDAKETLSIQVHPDDAYAREHENGSWGKSECWYVLDCPEGATLVVGHNAATREELCKMIEEKRWSEFIREVPIKKGDFIPIEAGTVHAIKSGVLLYEVQQNSDITYRVYDYDRKPGGMPRQLHVRQSMDVITVPSKKIEHSILDTTDFPDNEMNRLISWEYYQVWKLRITKPYVLPAQEEYLLFCVVDGAGELDGQKIHKGDHFLLPAGYGEATLTGEMELILSAP